MDTKLTFWGKSKYWWVILIVGILVILSGFFYWLQPAIGYAVASVLFGWLLIALGCVQVAVGGSQKKIPGKAWWVIGGFIDMTVGFFLVRSIILAETVFPYFLAIIFIYWGVVSLISAFSNSRGERWWLSLINGILMLILGYMFIESGWVEDMVSVNFLVSIAFIYWGFTLCILSYEIKLIGSGQIDKL